MVYSFCEVFMFFFCGLVIHLSLSIPESAFLRLVCTSRLWSKRKLSSYYLGGQFFMYDCVTWYGHLLCSVFSRSFVSKIWLKYRTSFSKEKKTGEKSWPATEILEKKSLLLFHFFAFFLVVFVSDFGGIFYLCFQS